MNMRALLPLMLALPLFFAGCGANSIMTPVGTSAGAADQKNFTAQDMRAAILRGCAEKNWRVIETSANSVDAMIIVNNMQTVVVSIPYTATSYMINYKASANMGYTVSSDGASSIDPNYNDWVFDLDKAIQMHIALKQ